MPFKIVRNADGSFKVKNTDTGRIATKKTSKKKAISQIRLLNSLAQKEWNRPPRKHVIFVASQSQLLTITGQRMSMETVLLTGVRPAY